MNKPGAPSTSTILLFAIWIIASLIAVMMAMNMDTAAIVDGKYIPVGNDALYHGRRILDAALGERGFYQFDEMIHVPQGSWINWPWAYDYLMALALMVALKFNPSLEPMAFVAHIPVAWTFVNAGLTLLICRRMQLSVSLTAIAMLAFCLSPLNQSLHGLGRIDHHYMELTFTLATVWLGLRFFDNRSSDKYVCLYGLALSLAPAFQNGLFILQLPALFIMWTLWLNGQALDAAKIRKFAITLFVGTLVVLLPSEPFFDLQFQFSTLSWFHLYIAACTAIVSIYLQRSAGHATRRKWLTLISLGVGLALPLAFNIWLGVAFISGEIQVLDQITEVKSPLRMYMESGDSLNVTGLYSWLIILSPVLLFAFAIRLFRSKDATQIAFSVFAVFCLLLLLSQFRFHPYGFWVLFIGPLVLADELTKRYSFNNGAVAALCLAVIAIAFQPPLKKQLFAIFPPNLSKDYAAGRSMFPVLQDACREAPGIVLATSNDGHPIRYHTDCSVIANNFIMTKLHIDKFDVSLHLINQTPEQMVATAPSISYVFARLYDLFEETPDGLVPRSLEQLRATNASLFADLLLNDEIPDSYELLGELRTEDERDIPFLRVFRIRHDLATPNQITENSRAATEQ